MPKDRGDQVGSDPSNRDGSIGVKLSGVGESSLWYESHRLWMRAISCCARTRFHRQDSFSFHARCGLRSCRYVCGFNEAPGGNSVALVDRRLVKRSRLPSTNSCFARAQLVWSLPPSTARPRGLHSLVRTFTLE